MLPALSRSKTVLKLHTAGGSFAYFSAVYDDDTGDLYKFLMISRQDWLDFGSPQEVTVTIDPGDTLNQRETP